MRFRSNVELTCTYVHALNNVFMYHLRIPSTISISVKIAGHCQYNGSTCHIRFASLKRKFFTIRKFPFIGRRQYLIFATTKIYKKTFMHLLRSCIIVYTKKKKTTSLYHYANTAIFPIVEDRRFYHISDEGYIFIYVPIKLQIAGL